ncbi:hypothetical protein Vadar_006720 [Vaccinium darrowii]|uniref:Uncharacterized protein n=1 Tax=Vaccinium darrowii TaxID=229202 RepID=A0ACB7ZHL8_9ERIC|nr:hypothetical protein Vadar_006720 [Vaccinium darrowii]
MTIKTKNEREDKEGYVCLPPVFNGFKSAVRTRGNTITFDDVITMLYGEDLQLSQESVTEPDVTSVLVATHGNTTGQKMINTTADQSALQRVNVPMFTQYDANAQSQNSQQSFMPQQQYFQMSRNSGKGRGFRGGRYFKDPCAICGKHNHTTNYCYHKNQPPQFDQSSSQWKPGSYQMYPWMYPTPSGYSVPQHFQMSGAMNGFSVTQPYQNSGGMFQSVAPANLGNYGTRNAIGHRQGVSQFGTAPQAHFTGAYQLPYMVPSTSEVSSGVSMSTQPASSGGISQQSFVPSYGGMSPQPWYFDSGATHHITNSLQNLNIAQPVAYGEGIMVGNGSQLPVTHTGQETIDQNLLVMSSRKKICKDQMEFNAPTSHHHLLLLLLRLLLLLVLAYLPFAMANTASKDPLKPGPPDKNIKDEDYTGLSNMFELTEEASVGQNKAQSCGVPELQCKVCKPCPPVFECPSTFQPETFKELKNDLGPVIRQRLMELLEKTRIVESAFEVVHTINMLKLLDESNSEFNVVREHMHNGAQRLREASQKLLGKKLQPQYVPQNKAAA